MRGDKPKTIRSRSPGFTLLELLVVVAIIAVLAAMLLPTLRQARNASTKSRCINSLRQLATALTLYTDDNGGYFPAAAQDPVTGAWQYDYGGWIPDIAPYVGLNPTSIPHTSIIYCQTKCTGTWAPSFKKWRYSINHDLRTGKKVNDLVPSAAKVMVFTENGTYSDVLHHHFLEYGLYGHPLYWPAGPAHEGLGIGISYLDGHAEFISPAPSRDTYKTDRNLPWTHKSFWGWLHPAPTETRGSYVAPYSP